MVFQHAKQCCVWLFACLYFSCLAVYGKNFTRIFFLLFVWVGFWNIFHCLHALKWKPLACLTGSNSQLVQTGRTGPATFCTLHIFIQLNNSKLYICGNLLQTCIIFLLSLHSLQQDDLGEWTYHNDPPHNKQVIYCKSHKQAKLEHFSK